jgi:hypothetical protein
MLKSTKVSQKEIELFLGEREVNLPALRRVVIVVFGFASEFPDLNDGDPSPGDKEIY